MKIKATVYNYSTHKSKTVTFPLTNAQMDKLLSEGEVMVDSCEILELEGEVGMTVKEFNDIVNLFSEKQIKPEVLEILSRTYLLKEIVEYIDEITIIDYDAETTDWLSSDFYSESDKGRVIYDAAYATFPVKVPEELEEYMDYAMLWRDAEINMGLRCVTVRGNNYIVALG